MFRFLFLAAPLFALLVTAASAQVQPSTPDTRGRPVAGVVPATPASRDDHAAWFRQAIDRFLDGRPDRSDVQSGR